MAYLDTPKIDYTDRDFVSIRDALIANIPYFTPEWTDTNPDDFGIVLLELFSGMGDILNWYNDRLCNENYLETALSRQSVARLLALIGVTMKGVQAAQTTLAFSLTAPELTDTVISAGTQCQTTGLSNVIYFETDSEVTILAGNLTAPSVSATEGQTIVVPSLGVSDGSQFQRFQLSQTNVLEDSLQVSVDGIVWEEYDSVILGGPSDRVWQLDKDAEDNLYVRFGDGVTGEIPVPTAVISVDYRVSDGIQGNVGLGTITTVVTVFPVTVNVTNTEIASGGGDPETIAAAKRRGPAEFKSLGRGVTTEDIATLATTVNGVAKTQATVTGVARMAIYVAPVGGGTASQALLDSVDDYLNTVRMATDGLVLYSANYVSIQILGTVTVISTFRQADVETAVLAALADYFDLENRVFGELNTPVGDVRISDVFEIIEGVEGVNYTELTILTMIPDPQWTIQSGNATFGAVSITDYTKDEVWTITFTSATAFNVRGTVSGLQIALGTTGVAYTSDDSEVSFTITAGGTPMAAGDNGGFRTSKKFGSVDVLPTEIAEEGVTGLTFTGGV